MSSPAAAGLRLRRVDLGEHVGRQAADAVELTGRIGAHGRSRGLERYCTRRAVAAATDRRGIDLHGGSRNAGGGQRRGHRLGARQAESERRRLGVRIVRRGVAVAGDRDHAAAPPRGELLQRVGSGWRQRGGTGHERHADRVGRVRRRRCRRGCRGTVVGAAAGAGGGAGRRLAATAEPALTAAAAAARRWAGGGGAAATGWRWRRRRRRSSGAAGAAGGAAGALSRRAGRGKRRALHRADRRLGGRRRRLGQRRWPAAGGEAAAGGASAAAIVALACRCRRRRWRRRRRHGASAEQGRRGTRQRRIGDRRRRGRVLRVGAVGDQRGGDVGQRGAVGRLGLRRHGGQIRIRLVGAGRRRPLFRDLAALQVVPPTHRVHRCGERRASGQQQRQRTARGGSAGQRCRIRAATSLNPLPRTPRLPATSAAQHRRIRSRPCPDVACGGADGKDAHGRPGQDRNHRVQAARPGGDRSLDGRHRRTLAAHRRRMAEAPGRRGARAGSAEHRQRVHGDDRAADGQPRQAGRGAAGLLAGLHDALAEHRAAHHGRARPSR